MIATAAHDRRRVDPAHASMRHASGRPGLSRDEEIELAARVARGDHRARNRMVQTNLGLVATIAGEFLGRGLDFDDLIGEGNLGLIRAAEEFDPRFGARFSTYASYWIKQAIRHALINTTSTIRLPAHMAGLLTKWRRAERSLRREFSRAPSFDEVATSLDLSEAQKAMVGRAINAGRLRVEGSYGDGTGARFLAEATGRHGPAEEQVEAEDERAALRRLMGRLDDRERAVLMLRFGLEGEILTFGEIGRRLGVSGGWACKIEARALRKLGGPQSDRAAGAHRRGDRSKVLGSAIT